MLLGSKMRVFRVTDYQLYLSFDRWRPALPLLYELGEAMPQVDNRLALTRFDAKPFQWSEAGVREVLSELVQAFLQIRGSNSDLNSFHPVFDTETDIDLTVVVRLIPNAPPHLSVANLRFNLADTEAGAPLAYDRLLALFRTLIAIARPAHGSVMTYPPITETWYEDLRVSIDLTRVPITTHWMNYYGPDWVERFGEAKIRRVPEGEVIDLPPGLVLVVQHEPFVYSNPDHVARQRRLDHYFELPKLHQQYPKRR